MAQERSLAIEGGISQKTFQNRQKSFLGENRRSNNEENLHYSIK